MKIVVISNEADFNTLKKANPGAEWIWIVPDNEVHLDNDTDAFFDLRPAADLNNPIARQIPCFANNVVDTTKTSAFIRINGWFGFLENQTWEVAGNVSDKAKDVLAFLGKRIIQAPDEPGLISARIIAMIINEAYFAKEEKVSTEEEIDIAMKLGTNYPYGPFEWANKIGHNNVYQLLKKLSLSDSRYTPALSLENLATSK